MPEKISYCHIYNIIPKGLLTTVLELISGI